MQNLRVGHYSNHEYGTGVSVFLFDKPAKAAYHLCGSAPASHELHVLELENSVTHIDGLALTGGSAYGLSSIEGVMRWLREKGRGIPTPSGPVPIVPIAGIFDLSVNQPLPPTNENAYQACQEAQLNNMEQGRMGAGTGASVGKLLPKTQSMSSGIGRAEIQLKNGLHVLAYAVVNSAGDVRDAKGNIIAGACNADGTFVDTEKSILSGADTIGLVVANTTLVAVFTNAGCSRAELKRIAKMAIAGMARAISPVFTLIDGDLLFCVSLGNHKAPEITIGVTAVEVVQQAIINAVKNSIIL
jgi:L-aminopeptidase/D-esterase-like protein